MDYAKLKEVFQKLLDAALDEQVYQDFLEVYPEFVPREFVQNHGVHFKLILRKVKFGADYVSDLLYLSKSSGDWNVVLVELEKPQSRYFKDDAGNLHPDFQAGLQQINRWRAWLSVQANRSYLFDTTLGPFRVPMAENQCFVKYVLVTGRREEAIQNQKKRALIAAEEREDLKILSFDSLLHLEDRPSSRYIGALRGGGLEIISDRYSGDSLFSWVSPDQVRITDALRMDCIAHKADWLTTLDVLQNTKVLDERLDKLGKVDGPTRKQLIAAVASLGTSLPT